MTAPKPDGITDREAVDLVEGLNVEEWADTAEKRGDTIRDLNAVLNSASAALAEHGVSEDVQETQTLAESIHQAVEAVRREVLLNLPLELERAVRQSGRPGVLIAPAAGITQKHLSQMLTKGVGSIDAWVKVLHAALAEATPHADTEAGS